MKIRYIKRPPQPRLPGYLPDTSSTYDIHLELPREDKGDPIETVEIGEVRQSFWGRGPHDGIRWEFPSGHPLANKYPGTLREAKCLVAEWVAECVSDAIKEKKKTRVYCSNS